jgi:hypothetical protein
MPATARHAATTTGGFTLLRPFLHNDHSHHHHISRNMNQLSSTMICLSNNSLHKRKIALSHHKNASTMS